MLPKPIKNLISQFAKFPSIGPRQAARFVFFLISNPEEIKNFISAFSGLNKITKCSFCHRAMEVTDKTNVHPLCSICSDEKRDKTTLCIVEKDTDLEAIEKTKKYNGLYYVLGISKFPIEEKKQELEYLNELIKKLQKSKVIKEIIIATSATTDGETIALYLSRLFKEKLPKIKISRLGRGLSTGSELDYMDEETLIHALTKRE